MKICYLLNNLSNKNGWGRFASHITNYVEKRGFDIIILKEDNRVSGGIPVLKGQNSRGYKMFTSALKIRKLIRECDVIHAIDLKPYGIISSLANIGINKKLLITAIGTYSVAPLYNWKTSLLSKFSYKSANHIAFISSYTKERVLSEVKIDNYSIINHGVELEKFYNDQAEHEGNFVLSVGSVKYRKGYHISIPAFADIKSEFPKLKYMIVGSKNEENCYYKKLLNLVEENDLELGEDIEFLGKVNEEKLKSLYGQAKLFVLPSVNQDNHFEGFGLVFLEAAAAGLPVIGTRGNGIRDVINHKNNGLLVEQENILKLSKAMKSILFDESKWKSMSKNSFQHAKKNSVQSEVGKYMELYKEINQNESNI